MPEMGVNGLAKVLAILPTTADSRKNPDPRYQLVTVKFVHDNAEVIHLYFTHQETEPLGVTPNHLLWSVTHGGWMYAGELQVGHVVKTKNGTETIVKKENKPGRHKVYNLEVHQSHTYYVSNIGVLAHNTKPELKTGKLPSAVGDYRVKFKDITVDASFISKFTDSGEIAEGLRKRGSKLPLNGKPLTFIKTKGDQYRFYDEKGELIMQVDRNRIKVVQWNDVPGKGRRANPNSHKPEYYQPTPDVLKKQLGFK